MGYITTYVPADPGSAPTAAIPGAPAQVIIDYRPGWTATAASSTVLDGDGALSFSIPDVEGVIIGLAAGAVGVDLAQINWALRFGPDDFHVMESGALVGAGRIYTAGDTFSIKRLDGEIGYYQNDALIYTSASFSDADLLVNAGLYYGGDAIDGATLTGLTSADDTCSGSFAPMVGQASDEAVSPDGVQGAFQPLTTEIDATEIISVVGAASAVLQPLTTSMAFVTTETVEVEANLLPMTTLAADYEYAEVRATMAPMASISGDDLLTGAFALLAMPSGFTLHASLIPLQPTSLKASIGFSFRGYCGAVARLTMPSPSLVAAGTITNVARAQLTMPMPMLTASVLAGNVARARLVLPGYALFAYCGSSARLALEGEFSLTASGLSGGVMRAKLAMPQFVVTAHATQENFGRARLVMPMLIVVPSARANLTLPMPLLTASIKTMVAAEYEAYAINLKPGAETPNQVTHYTDFPFNQIVRFNNAYYGVAADGLYLLEGDTDAGAPIAWNWQSALSDFESRHFKRAVSAYIGGRLGDETELRVIVGEQSESDYAYAAVRGSNAQTYRSKFGRGLKSRYYAIGMQDQNGSAVEIDTIELEIEELTRSI